MDKEDFFIGKFETYPENSRPSRIPKEGQRIMYQPRFGEVVKVTSYAQFPSYDIIFGYPVHSNKHYEKETGMFCLRKMKDDKYTEWQLYVDANELEILVDGFTDLMVTSKISRPALWQEPYQKLKNSLNLSPAPMDGN